MLDFNLGYGQWSWMVRVIDKSKCRIQPFTKGKYFYGQTSNNCTNCKPFKKKVHQRIGDTRKFILNHWGEATV